MLILQRIAQWLLRLGKRPESRRAQENRGLLDEISPIHPQSRET